MDFVTRSEALSKANPNNPNIIYNVKHVSGFSQVYYSPLHEKQIWIWNSNDGHRRVYDNSIDSHIADVRRNVLIKSRGFYVSRDIVYTSEQETEADALNWIQSQDPRKIYRVPVRETEGKESVVGGCYFNYFEDNTVYGPFGDN